MPTGSLIQCGHCGSPVAAGADACPDCGQPVTVSVFPAIQQSFHGARPEALVGSDEAACYFHADHRAVIACDHCGRFLCALCDLPVEGRHLCSPCLAASARGSLVSQRMRYDSLALMLSTWSFLTAYMSVIACCAALWFVVRHWNDPPGPFPRGRWRFVVATVCALAQIALWGGIVGFVIWRGVST